MPAQAEVLDQAPREALRVLDVVLVVGAGLSDPTRVAREHTAIAPVIAGVRPARELLARIPLALAMMQESPRAPEREQPPHQAIGERRLLPAERGRVPLGRVC